MSRAANRRSGQEDWKAIRLNVGRGPDGPVELYNLRDDIGETEQPGREGACDRSTDGGFDVAGPHALKNRQFWRRAKTETGRQTYK